MKIEQRLYYVKRVTRYKQVPDPIMMPYFLIKPNLKKSIFSKKFAFWSCLNQSVHLTSFKHSWKCYMPRNCSLNRFFYLSKRSFWNHIQYNSGHTPDYSVCYFDSYRKRSQFFFTFYNPFSPEKLCVFRATWKTPNYTDNQRILQNRCLFLR